MNATEITVFEAVTRVKPFAVTHADAFPPTSKAATDFARVGTLIKEIGAPGQQVGSPASPATLAKIALLDEVWEDLKNIAKTARSIDKKEPGTATSFKLPKVTQRKIVKTATDFLENLDDPALVAKFVAYSLPADFVSNLQDDIEAIEKLGGEQDDDEQEASGDTARIRALIKEARELLKSLDTSVTNRFGRDPEIMAQWKAAARIHRAPRRARQAPAEGESTTVESTKL